MRECKHRRDLQVDADGGEDDGHRRVSGSWAFSRVILTVDGFARSRLAWLFNEASLSVASWKICRVAGRNECTVVLRVVDD